MFNFEKLDVWQKAIDFADLIYTNTRSFPADAYAAAEEESRMLSGLRRSLLGAK
jgi:hypothetical protein